MKNLLAFILCINALASFAQDKCSAIIDWKYNGTINIYDKPNGEIVEQIKNDSANEDYLAVIILDEKDNYFLASLELPVKSITKKGWIEKADYIGAYIKHEKFPMDLTLYKFNRISETDKIVIKSWNPGLLTIEKCNGKWTYVTVKQSGQTNKGWIESEKLCANAYTTCN